MLAKEARKSTNVADCHVTAFQCHPFLQRIAGLAGWVLVSCSRQPSEGSMTQNITPLFGPTCLGAQTWAPPSGAITLFILS
jgi:hypothetical protein